MNKCKIIKRNGLTQIMMKSVKGQQLDIAKVYAINNNQIPGLLYVQVEQKGLSFKLLYDITGFMPFRQYLNTPLDKKTFSCMLKRVLDILQAMQTMHFNQQCLLLDFDYVMVIPSTQEICFAYVPIQNYENGTSLRDFLLNIIQFALFSAEEEDKEYVKEYIKILNSGINFSVFDLREYVSRLSEKPRSSVKTCPKCNKPIIEGSKFCLYCGIKLIEEPGNSDRDTYDPLKDAPKQKERSDSDAEKKDSAIPGDTQDIGDKTTVLSTEPGGTTVLGSGDLREPVYPYLIRKKGEEKIMLDKPVFRIGKEKQYCDYFVADNTTVSRSHADIITQNERYYIEDLKSTNGTFVDGKRIPEKQKVELFSGTEIRLSNEEFVFYLGEGV